MENEKPFSGTNGYGMLAFVLMVVLCSDESARPVINAGTLNQ